jgi:3-hydroxyisobutyrate dehydrogenase-like beta-hydroxyacid dehydrogenase
VKRISLDIDGHMSELFMVVHFGLSLMHKDLSLVLSQASDLAVSMPTTAAAQQMYTAAMAQGMDEDFSIMIQLMEELAGVSPISEEPRRK